ncbi:MAG: hypothetical protein ACI35Q_02860 [Marinilabiliaceae bacterium]
MANLDLNSIWETVKSATQGAKGGSLSESSLTSIAKDIIAGVAEGAQSKTHAASSTSGGVDFIGIAKQLLSLYEKFKGSSDSGDKATAINIKGISDIVGAMGGDKGSIISTGASILGKALGGDSQKKEGGDLGSALGGVLGGLFGK